MSSTKKSILISGATGKQGGALIKALLAADPQFTQDLLILAVTRNPDSASAQALANKSPKIKLIKGDLNDCEALFTEAEKVLGGEKVWGVFSVQTAIGADVGSELDLGRALVDAALVHSVQLFVYSSVDRGGPVKSPTTPTNIPHFIHKHEIEQHLVASSEDGKKMGYTILRPTAFYENLTPDFLGKVTATSLRMFVSERPLQMIGVSDIGHFAAQAFLYPDQYQGQCISLAGDELTYPEMERIFREVTGGQKIKQTWGLLAMLVHRMIPDVGIMFKWFKSDGYGVDIEELRRQHPRLKSFKEWLETESAWAKNGERST